MKEKGIPHLNNYGRGNKLVRIQVWVPTKLNAREKELLRELSSSEHIVPTEDEKSANRSFFEKMKNAFM